MPSDLEYYRDNPKLYQEMTGRSIDRDFPNNPVKYRPNIKFKSSVKSAVWDKTGGFCFYCGIALNPWRNFSIDHVIPISKGGTDDFPNLVPACCSCNSRKGAG